SEASSLSMALEQPLDDFAKTTERAAEQARMLERVIREEHERLMSASDKLASRSLEVAESVQSRIVELGTTTSGAGRQREEGGASPQEAAEALAPATKNTLDQVEASTSAYLRQSDELGSASRAAVDRMDDMRRAVYAVSSDLNAATADAGKVAQDIIE